MASRGDAPRNIWRSGNLFCDGVCVARTSMSDGPDGAVPAAFGVLSAMASSYGFDSHQVQIALRSAAPAKVLAAAALAKMRCWAVLRLS